MKHTYDPKIGVSHDVAIWHQDSKMESLVIDIVTKLSPRYWIETGTHLGWTSHWMASRFPDLDIRTIELSEEYYALAKENLADCTNVHMGLGDSRHFLRHLVSRLDGLPIFWLDAHFNEDHPLREECSIVTKSTQPFICLIDDYPWPHEGHVGVRDYVETELGVDYYQPAYKNPSQGYALFVRGVEYVPPVFMQKAYPSGTT